MANFQQTVMSSEGNLTRSFRLLSLKKTRARVVYKGRSTKTSQDCTIKLIKVKVMQLREMMLIWTTRISVVKFCMYFGSSALRFC